MTMTENETQSSDEYNGWPNRETWAASLHLSNDYGLYTMVNGWAEDARAEATGSEAVGRGWQTIERQTVFELADMLRDYIETLRADMQTGEEVSETERMMVLEIGSEWRVDWRHLAENWLEGFEFEGEES